MRRAFVFPGQGAQTVGMGRDLFENSPAARAAFAAVDAACGFSVSALCFDGPDERLKETRFTQPALYAVHVAALAACREAGLEPDAVAGHSIGEYAALVAAGALSVDDGARLVALRGAAMARAGAASPGTMAAVLGLDADTVRAVCAATTGVVVPANDNAPGQIVISGQSDAVAAASVALKAAGAKRVLPLAVSGAFHSPLMEPAAHELRAALTTASVHDPALPVVANITADFVGTAAQVRENLAAQVAGPVRWVESVQRLAAAGVAEFVECGPGSVLAGLIKRIAPEAVTWSAGDTAAVRAAREALG
jgi:[acyl-carrier-protein] S-malonyltransferase